MSDTQEGFWWCPECKEEVGAYHVTNQERHEQCGSSVEYLQDRSLAERNAQLERDLAAALRERDMIAQETIERCAKVCESHVGEDTRSYDGISIEQATKIADDEAHICADNIRALSAPAIREEWEHKCEDAERYRWEREHPAWETEMFLSDLTPKQYDAEIDKARGKK